MKNERPILFSAPMVRALLAGQKTQTRRIVRRNEAGRVKQVGGPKNWHLDDPNAVQACPYGQPGDHLWVRETFRECDMSGSKSILECEPWEFGFEYKADSPVDLPTFRYSQWKSPIHMPRSAARVVLEITGVRVERLQEITDEEARAEGVESARWTNGNGTFTMTSTPRATFAGLWNEINSTRAPWESNPWVWVIEFKLMER